MMTTEQSLQMFVERVDEDEDFRERVHRDPAGALAEFDLRPPVQVALSSDDEDVLRRLAGARVQEEARFWTGVKKALSRVFCGPGGTRSWQCPDRS